MDRTESERDGASNAVRTAGGNPDASGGADTRADAAGAAAEMTLAFHLAALESLADPAAVFADARGWAAHVGVVHDDAEAVESAVSRHGIRQDYEMSGLDVQSVLSRLKWEADTERYVFVGTDAVHRELADYVGWEYLPVEEAAEKADWTLLDDLGPLARLRRWLDGLVG